MPKSKSTPQQIRQQLQQQQQQQKQQLQKEWQHQQQQQEQQKEQEQQQLQRQPENEVGMVNYKTLSPAQDMQAGIDQSRSGLLTTPGIIY